MTRVRAVARRVPCTRRDAVKHVGLTALLDSHQLHFNYHPKANRLRYTRVRRDRPQVKADSGQSSVQMQRPRDVYGRGGKAWAERSAVIANPRAQAAQRIRHGREPPRRVPRGSGSATVSLHLNGAGLPTAFAVRVLRKKLSGQFLPVQRNA